MLGWLVKTLRSLCGKWHRDDKYRASYNGVPCLICWTTDTTVGCHIRTNSGAGMSTKPHDFWTLPLCYPHHTEQHKIGEEQFYMFHKGWTIRQAKIYAAKRYRKWKGET